MTDSLRRLGDNVVVRLVFWYGALLGLYWALRAWLPDMGVVASGSFSSVLAPATGGGSLVPPSSGLAALSQTALAGPVAMAMVSAVLLVLPVAWVYMATRIRKGYQQSVVHTLLMLPVVVAGIVVMVKYSLTLAFALAGIVAAVRFRNSLDDSKDAVYVFLSVGMGLAAAVDIPVAFTISVIFNIVMLGLYYTDFGRSPAFEGPLARRRMDSAMQAMTRTGSFVARIDRDILGDMSPEQLDAVADRARRRRKEMAAWDLGGDADNAIRLRVITMDPDGARPAIENFLMERVKKWELDGVIDEPDGSAVIEYSLRLRKNTIPGDLATTLRATLPNHVHAAEVD